MKKSGPPLSRGRPSEIPRATTPGWSATSRRWWSTSRAWSTTPARS